MEWMVLGLLIVPLLGALVAGLAPLDGKSEKLLHIGLGAALVEMVLGILVFVEFPDGSAQAHFRTTISWFSLLGIPVHLDIGVDGLSVLMVLLTGILMPLVFVSAAGHIKERRKEFTVWALIMTSGMIGVFLALDVILFYIFWELTLVPLYFIIGIWGGARKFYAAIKFFLFTLAGSLLMLVGVIILLQTANTSDITALAAASIPASTQMTCFLLFAIGFAVKVPMVPFHTWLPDAHVEAPTGGSVILAGVLLKMGSYGFLRFCLPMFPDATVRVAPFAMALGAIGVVYGAFLAWAQQDMKKLVAYSSISHLGMITVGLFSLNAIGIQGGLIQMFNHGVSTGALFLLVGVLYDRRHTRDIADYGGIARVMPLFAFAFGVISFSSIGLPGLNGFIGEFLILQGTFLSSPWFAALAGLGVILGAIYMLSMLRRTLFGELKHEENRSLKDLLPRERWAIFPLVALVIWVGIAPQAFLVKSEGSVAAIAKKLEGIKVSINDQGEPK